MSSTTSGEDDAITVPLPTLTALPDGDQLTAANGRRSIVSKDSDGREPHQGSAQTGAIPDATLHQAPREADPAVSPFAPRRRRRGLREAVSGKSAAAMAIIAVVIVVAALVVHVGGGSSQPDSASTTTITPAETAPQLADQTRLAVLLSSAFRDAMSCQPGETNPAGTLASVHCVPRGQRPEAPAEATYRLVAQKDNLDAVLKAALSRTTVQLCPGNILSPGPWHLANPNNPSGTLFCGTRGDVAVVGWTDTNKLTLAEISSAPMPSPPLSGPALAGLYRWWQMNAYRN